MIHSKFRLSAIRVENELVSRRLLAAGRGRQPAASALRLTGHGNQHEWRRAQIPNAVERSPSLTGRVADSFASRRWVEDEVSELPIKKQRWRYFSRSERYHACRLELLSVWHQLHRLMEFNFGRLIKGQPGRAGGLVDE